MTDFTTSQSFQFRLTGVTGGSFNSRTRQNVKKRVESIIYLESPPDDAVRLAYVGSSEVSPENNLFIGDRSDSLFANSRVGNTQEFTGTNQPVTIRNKNFIITQAFNEAESGDIPLYYKHVFSTAPADFLPVSVRVYDKNFEPVSTDKYKLGRTLTYSESTGAPNSPEVITGYHLYNNLKSSFDVTTGEYEVYYIQYTEFVDSIEATKTELLNNELAFPEATVEDIWWVTGKVKPWIDAYLVDTTGTDLLVELPTPAAYAVRYEEVDRIRVNPPAVLNDTSPWFPRVVNGSFRTGYDTYSFEYRIPEFENQAFNPIEPYKVAVRAGCSKISDSLIKLPHKEIQSGSLFSYLYLTAELEGIVQYAVTDDPAKVGDEYRDMDNNRVLDSDGDAILWSSDQLLGIDSLSGIVHVSFDVDDSYEIYATYSYREIYYELTSLNMNPVFDQLASQEVRAIYLVPESSTNNNLGQQTAAVRWVKVSPSGLIGSTNQDNSGGNGDLTEDVGLATTDGYALSGIVGLHYNWRTSATSSVYQEVIEGSNLAVSSTSNFPRSGWIRFLDSSSVMRYAKFTDKTDTALELSATAGEVASSAGGVFVDLGTTIEMVNFVDERTTLSNRTASDEKTYLPSG
ncbi:MAG: hypothetical protein ACXABY_20545, partial [Candidatus Thorarchaeota archaeon]